MGWTGGTGNGGAVVASHIAVTETATEEEVDPFPLVVGPGTRGSPTQVTVDGRRCGVDDEGPVVTVARTTRRDLGGWSPLPRLGSSLLPSLRHLPRSPRTIASLLFTRWVSDLRRFIRNGAPGSDTRV